ncbi:MAG: hypothetical protein ACM3O5_01580 [Betaproteobacteria bacterium]
MPGEEDGIGAAMRMLSDQGVGPGPAGGGTVAAAWGCQFRAFDQDQGDPRRLDRASPLFSFASEPLPSLESVGFDLRAAPHMGMGSRSCLAAMAVALLAVSQDAGAQKPSHDEERARDSDICGYQLMTERERSQYRERVQRSGGGEELDRIRSEHREQMQARARERGVVLSCDKPGETRQIKAMGALHSDSGSTPRSRSTAVVAVHHESEAGSGGR